ncbi:MAG: hypothetical protein AUG51_23015 [Acidobacteria bacterium 13_1_20CM_3_53_8]|nr:MAG: hypothetical protein AUG51_23015 [Acidobacteria bacterium 13_1_20CM_3_53_8]
MPSDQRDDASSVPPPPGEEKREVRKALESETDEPLPPAAERAAERDANRETPRTPQGWRRRWLTRRNAFIATIAIAVGLVALILLAVLTYRLGYVDRYIANQIKNTFANYGIRADIREFHTAISPRTVEMSDVQLYDAQTGERLGKIDRILATVRVTDLYSLSLKRNINLESLTMDGLEAWVQFDEQGRSNFRNLHLPPPEPNKRILFSYSTAQVQINNAVIHYGDQQHSISGEARNIRATVQPDDPAAPTESWMNTVTLSASNSTFVYDGRPVNDISLDARGRINQTRAEVQDLVLRSPLAEARIVGVMDDWRNLTYNMQTTARVDLTQLSDVLHASTTMRGVGQFVGKISGEGERYRVDGQITSDALAADGVRLQALNLTASGTGQGKSYDMNGRAVAQLLTAGDFQLNAIQLTGHVMGTGTDFRWLGELRSQAARYGATSIAGLILNDVAAEMRDQTLTVSAGHGGAGQVLSAGASVGGVTVSDIRARSENGTTSGGAASAQAGTITASGARVNGLTANGIDFTSHEGGATDVTVDSLRVGSVNAGGAQTGSLNIAGVRLAILNGRVEGSSGDVNAGTVTVAKTQDFAGGQVENVRLAHPVFVVEPSGRYRASADLSLGGGVLGQVNLGAARAALVATNNQIQLQNFTADVMGGRAAGNATVSTARGGASQVAANFSDLDIGKLLSLTSGRVVPVAGKATGEVNLSFPGTNLQAASGTVRADFNAETGDETSGRTPLNGTVALRATRGLFEIEQANLKTASSELTATGQFSFTSDQSNLQVNLNSSDASDLRNIIVSSGLLPDISDQLDAYNIELGGHLAFNGTLRGKLTEPSVDGRFTLDSLSINGHDMGALSAIMNSTPDVFRITDGQLAERDGGGIKFTLDAPLAGKNNVSLTAQLDRTNGGNLLAAIDAFTNKQDSFGPTKTPTYSSLDFQSDVSGQVSVTGIPNAMQGNADLRFAPGQIRGEPFQSIIARATFNGPKINLETVDAQFNAGHLLANGTYDTSNQAFDIQAHGTGINLALLESLTGNRVVGVPQLTGTADIEGHATGVFSAHDFSNFQINFTGTGHDVSVNGRPAGELSLVGRTENGRLNVTFTTGLLGQPQVVTAEVNLTDRTLPTTINTTLSAANLQPLFAALLPESTVRLSGRATGTLTATGPLFAENEEGEQVFGLAGLRGRAEISDLTIQIEDVQLVAVSPLLVQFQSNEIFFEKTEFRGPGTDVTFGGTAALGPGGRQNLSIDGNLNLRVLNGISPDVFSAGSAVVAVRVMGSYEEPRFSGTASVEGASVAALIGNERLTIDNIKGNVRFNQKLAQIESLTGNLGGGRIVAAGGVLLEDFSNIRFRFTVRGDDVIVPFPEDFRSTADADLVISGTTRQQLISGTVNLRRAEYTKQIELADLLNRRHEVIVSQTESPLVETTQLDLSVEGRDALVVRNNLADMVGSVSLRITGSVKDPTISGRITATRGTLNFRNDRYELTRAFIDLPPRRDADPILNIEAESEIKGYRVIVSLTGPLSQPQATVRSDPSLPQADVVALITTGNLSTDETSTSALAQTGLGTAASLLTDTLINAPAQKATDRLFGLNRFEIDPLISGRGGASPTARLTVGRQINRDLTITYSTNIAADPNQILALEYRVSNRLSFIAQYEQGSSTRNLRSSNNSFSFEIRFRKRF